MAGPEKRAVGPGTQVVRADAVRATSWVDVTKTSGHIGDIYFVTDDATLSDQDYAELEKIVRAYPPKLNVKHVTFRFHGYADYRHTKEHNYDLAKRRADAVASYVGDPARLGAYPNYTTDVRGLGIDHHSDGLPPNSGALALFRRVEIWAEPIGPAPITQPTGSAPSIPTSTRWVAKLLNGQSVGEVVGVETLVVEIKDMTNKLQMHYRFIGEGLTVGGFASFSGESEQTAFFTKKEIKITDFAGGAHHTSAQLQVGFGFGVDWLVPMGPHDHCDEEVQELEFKGFSLLDKAVSVGALTTIGTLEPIRKTPEPY